MAIIPESLEEVEEDVIETELPEQPSLTYRIVGDRIIGRVDGKQAIQQFIAKALRTALKRFLIYDDQYGCELEDLLGADVTRELIDEEIPRVIREALIYDDRISDVTNFDITHTGDTVHVKFTAVLANNERLDSEVIV